LIAIRDGHGLLLPQGLDKRVNLENKKC